MLSSCKNTILSKISVPTSKKLHHISITKVSRLETFKKVIAVYVENQRTRKYTVWGSKLLYTGGTYSDLCRIKS
jgi:hypothetical protein